MLSEGLGSSVRRRQTLKPRSHRELTALPASGADAPPRTTDFMSSDSALSLAATLLTGDESGRAFGDRAAARLFAPRSAQETAQVLRSAAAALLRRALPEASSRALGPGVPAKRNCRLQPGLIRGLAPPSLRLAALPRRGCSSSRRSRTSCWSTARRPFLGGFSFEVQRRLSNRELRPSVNATKCVAFTPGRERTASCPRVKVKPFGRPLRVRP